MATADTVAVVVVVVKVAAAAVVAAADQPEVAAAMATRAGSAQRLDSERAEPERALAVQAALLLAPRAAHTQAALADREDQVERVATGQRASQESRATR